MRILDVGARLAGRYTLIRRLGAGNMAELWLATDRQSDARLALKFTTGDDPRSKDLLHREWRISSRLMHANIVRVFEFHDDPDGAFYGLQYVGDTTIAVLSGKDPAESMRPLAMIADALRYAHGKGIVHRDIKADNILLDSRGLPYLTDFGVAAPAGSDEMAASGTQIASSPEQLAGAAASGADDIFALGVLMHELLTGLPPGGADRQQRAATLADGAPLPTALAALLSDMLAQDGSRRPDAETVADRLAAAGFPPGPAPARYTSGESGIDEVVASVASVPKFRQRGARPKQAAELTGKSVGIPPKVLYGSLAGALMILLAVIFVLPRVVDRERAAVGDDSLQVEAPDAAQPSIADAAADDATQSDGKTAAGDTAFSENLSTAAGIKVATDEALGDLLSQLERLRYRAIDRWGGQPYLDAVDVYAAGDQAYVDRNYRLAGEKYRQASRMLEPFFERIDSVFDATLAAAKAAFAAADHAEAVRLFDLAVAITPGNREAEAGLARARNLEAVLSLTDQGLRFEDDLELDAARLAFEKALALDAAWEPAALGLERVRIALKNLTFEQRMTEGFDALVAGDYASARAAFEAAKLLDPTSSQPADGLLQVDQEIRLAEIGRLEGEARSLDSAERWESSVLVYEDILKIDPDLQFAQEGLAAARARAALHARLQGYIAEPDTLSDQATMQGATQLLLDVTRMQPMGPRLEDQKNELSRLLKRAATPLRVQLISDNLTDVSVFKVGRFGSFTARELELRPGNYVAVGIRQGFRDVRVEFRVAPEIDLQPVVVRCEEPI